ncbi:MAG: 4'-phosphopantetheinyl transferase family protein, partial [Chloroflexota bacterium]
MYIPDWRPPPAAFALPRGTADLWRVGLTDPSGLMERLLAVLSDEERGRADRFHFQADRRRFIVSHGALRLILGRYTASDPASLRFNLGSHGKPTLGGGRALRFNLSHSGELALIALSPDRELGVDVELVRDVPDLAAIAARFFTSSEQDVLRGLPAPERVRAFLVGWTRKEAVMKALGLGVALSPESIEVSLEEGYAAVHRIAGRPADSWTMTAFAPAPGSIGALAMQGPPPALSYWEWADGFTGGMT